MKMKGHANLYSVARLLPSPLFIAQGTEAVKLKVKDFFFKDSPVIAVSGDVFSILSLFNAEDHLTMTNLG